MCRNSSGLFTLMLLFASSTSAQVKMPQWLQQSIASSPYMQQAVYNNDSIALHYTIKELHQNPFNGYAHSLLALHKPSYPLRNALRYLPEEDQSLRRHIIQQHVSRLNNDAPTTTQNKAQAIIQGQWTPRMLEEYCMQLIEQEDYERYYDIILNNLSALREHQILPNDHYSIAPEIAIKKLTTLRHTALQAGQTAQTRSYTYWLGRFYYAAQRYAEAATYLQNFEEEYARLIDSYYQSYQFAKADSLLEKNSLPHIGYTASPLAPYIKLWLGQYDEAIRLAEHQVGLNVLSYATTVNNNIVFPQVLFDIYTNTGRREDALRLLEIRQRYNTYHNDLSAVGNLPLFNGYLRLGETEKAQQIAINIVSEATAYTTSNWGYTYPHVLQVAEAPESAATEYATLTADNNTPNSAFLSLLAYHCTNNDLSTAQTFLVKHTPLLPHEALSLFLNPTYHPLLKSPQVEAYFKQQLPPNIIQQLKDWQ